MADSLKEILPIFLAELDEQLARMSRDVLVLERALEPDALQTFLRDAHSIKGTAGSFGFEEIAKVAHAIEELMAPVQVGGRTPTRAEVDKVLDALSAIRSRGTAIQTGGAESKGGFDALNQALEALKSGAAVPSPPLVALDPPPAVETKASGDTQRPAEDMIRISRSHLQQLERRVDLLRQVRGRVSQRAVQLAEAYRSLGELHQRSGDPRLRDVTRNLRALSHGLVEDEAQLGLQVRDLDDTLRVAQLVPMNALLESLRPAVLLHVRRSGKEVQLELRGGELKLDRRLFENLKDPLVHILRNAVDHGLETPSERTAQGKSPTGALRVHAYEDAETLRVDVTEDGRGIDLARVRARACEKGLLTAAEAAALSDAEAQALIFKPGFSTTDQVTETSGRGIGLDVVASAVQRLSGTVEVESSPGQGTRISLALPRAQSAEPVFVMELSGRKVALRMSSVDRMVQVRASEVERLCGQPTLRLNDKPVRLLSLAELLGLPEWESEKGRFAVLVLRSTGGKERLAVRCGKLLGIRDAVLRPLARELLGLMHLSSAADLGDGQAVFVLNEEHLFGGIRAEDTNAPPAAPVKVPTILVVDDTVTTRALHRRSLEAAGFRVLAAANGQEALRVMESQEVHLVVTDLEMPQLDGIGLIQRMRASARFARIPAILVSSLAAESRKGKLGSQGLADAYITKSHYSHSTLLESIQRLLRVAP